MSSEKQSLGAALNDALGSGPNAERLLYQRARLIEWEERRRHSLWGRLFGVSFGSLLQQPRVLLALGLCNALTVLALFWSSGTSEHSALTATLEGASLHENAWVTAANHTETLTFSEGSRIVVAEGGRARVGKLGPEGLRMTLESGKLEATITPKTGYRWVVQAGPHTVTVLGTVFSVEWSAEQQLLNVAVERGRVQVDSADGRSTLGSPVARVLQAGERLSVGPPLASASAGATLGASPSTIPSVTGSAGESDQAAVKAEGEQVAALEDKAPEDARQGVERAPTRSLARSSAVVTEPSPSAPSVDTASKAAVEPEAIAGNSWKELADADRYAEAVSAARALGVGSLLSSLGDTDLMLLADAARLGKAPDLAQQVLLAIRERFPNQSNAKLAAFQLGHLALEVKHDYPSAVRWFQTYLDAAPNGVMAEGARARLLRAWLRLGDQEKARAAATEYLRHHPDGHHASDAQSLLGH